MRLHRLVFENGRSIKIKRIAAQPNFQSYLSFCTRLKHTYLFSATRNKIKTIVLVLCVFGLYVLVMTPDDFSKKERSLNHDVAVNPVFNPPLEDHNKAQTHALSSQMCSKEPHIYYVKIHKTGSSTFQNILYRLGMRRKMAFALFGCAYGMTYPHPPKKEYLFQDPTYEGFENYDLLTDHTQFNSQVYKEYMPEDTKVITLLRHPLQQLKSTFGFWGLPAKFGIWNADVIQEYVNNPSKYEQKRPSFGCPPTIEISQTKNPQTHHLGLNQDNPTDAEISYLKKTMDDEFSLVMILERFEESLLLFKRMFCLSMQDIIHLNIFSTKFFNRKTYDYNETLEEAIINKHRSWSGADYDIYDHFSLKLDEKVQSLGEDFQDELLELRKTKDSVREFCIESCNVFSDLATKPVEDARTRLNSEYMLVPASKWSPAFNLTRGDCGLMMFETLIYDEAIKANQWPTGCMDYTGQSSQNDPSSRKMPHVNSKYCNKDNHFVSNFPWDVLRSSTYFTKTGCLKNF